MTMNTTITIEHLRTMPVGEIAALDAAQLARLQTEAIKAVSTAKLTKDLLDGVLNHKYGEQAAEFRHMKGKDFGTVRFDDGDVTVISDLPKKPVWDQKQLSSIVRKIQESGDDPSEYVDTAFKVSESKFNAWPEHIRRTFEPARTLKAGKPIFKLTRNEEGGVQ
ncbi:MAG: hypothetical protein HQL72_02530 [Magnetococcales bacterium]|nr:hypothetical protein [Magnetococcales bacterium]